MSVSHKFKQSGHVHRWSPWFVILISALVVSLPLMAAILPEDRADALFHSYDGGGAEIHGPSIMARKQVGQHFSFWANYYMDFISSATIDVKTFASPYTEQRAQYTVAGDYLYQNSTLSFSYTNSEESDYSADTYSFDMSQNMFGDLTTVSLGYSRGINSVRRNSYSGTGADKQIISSPEVGTTDRWQYRLNWSQILTKDFIVNLGYESVSDEGFLNNPYRSVAVADPSDPLSPDDIRIVVFKPESGRYPKTHTSNAFSIKGKYYLPWRAALQGEYRSFSDSWDIKANMYEVAVTQPIKKNLTFDFHYRAYSQTAASFYSNMFRTEKVYMGRDKELSAFSNTTFGAAVSYEFMRKGWWIFDKGSMNLSYDRIQLNYDNFLDESAVKTKTNPSPTVEQWTSAKPYSFSTNVIQFYLSVWY